MELFEAIASRACVRALEPVAVPEADLLKILEAGQRAPSGRNTQPLEFIVVKDPAAIAALAGAQSCLGDVGLVILLAGDPERSQYWLEDVSAATTQMLLALHALGYASVWIEGTLLRQEETLKPLFGIPEHMRLVVALPIGKPTQPVTPRDKRPLTEMVFWEKYGQARA